MDVSCKCEICGRCAGKQPITRYLDGNNVTFAHTSCLDARIRTNPVVTPETHDTFVCDGNPVTVTVRMDIKHRDKVGQYIDMFVESTVAGRVQEKLLVFMAWCGLLNPDGMTYIHQNPGAIYSIFVDAYGEAFDVPTVEHVWSDFAIRLSQ
jgi:hypothetical protein